MLYIHASENIFFHTSKFYLSYHNSGRSYTYFALFCPLVVRNAMTPHNCNFLYVKIVRILSVRFSTLFNTRNQMKYLLLSLLVCVSIVSGNNEPGKALDEREKSNSFKFSQMQITVAIL